MKSVDIYVLTRIENENNLRRLERQMSGRTYFLNIKEWEVACLREVAEQLLHRVGFSNMNYYYSYQIPKLGKEFDLLRITDTHVINIELKSGEVSDEKIKHQLLKNRYYLASLGKNIRSYTYIKDENRLLRLTKSENLIESDFDKLAEDIIKAGNEFSGDIESLFREENYIISPLSDPERFLRRDYFLTSQQNDIRSNILKNAKAGRFSYQGFTGLPGTGKTLLLYDLAMKLSDKQKVCVMHFGSFPEEMTKLDDRLKRIDFFKCSEKIDDLENKISDYNAILIDEGHRITPYYLELILRVSKSRQLPVIFSYDSEDAIFEDELNYNVSREIEAIDGFIKYKLTNRIRMNSELSSFITALIKPYKYRRKNGYPSINVSYANDLEEAKKLIQKYEEESYVYIADSDYSGIINPGKYSISAKKATCREFDKVVMLIDSTFSYQEEYLRCSSKRNGESGVRILFHGLNRAKKRIAIIVLENEAVFEAILSLLQGKGIYR